MEQVLANRSVSITELKRSPSAVLKQAGTEPVAVLNHNRRAATQEGVDSGPASAAEDVFAEPTARYAEADSKPATKILASNARLDGSAGSICDLLSRARWIDSDRAGVA